jgi:hypothetical protein
MDDLTHTLRVLCQRNRDGSHATQADRRGTLTLISRQLKAAGFRCMTAGSLKSKHVDALLNRWLAERLQAGTIKNRMAALRWWAEKIGRAGIIPADNDQLGIPRRVLVTNENKARCLNNLERVTDPHVRMSLELQQQFGLRRRECIKFQPRYADRGDHIALKASWTKGGRPRTLLITSAEQRAVLDAAHRFVGAGSLIPAHKTSIQQRNTYDDQCKAAKLSKMHGLRHLYAQTRHEALTGFKAPAAGGPVAAQVRWNVGGYVRNPDTARRVRRPRPQDERVEHCDEGVRIIADELFQRAQKRNRIRSTSDRRMESGGKPKYLLSGLLHCGNCNAHYILHDSRSYACSGHKGGACDNHIRVRRDRLESAILSPLRDEMLAPERVAQMAKEMQMSLLERMHKSKMHAAEQPHELTELDARIARLRKRMAAGDPDITPDELRAALDLAEYKRRELAYANPPTSAEARSCSPCCRVRQNFIAARSRWVSTARTRKSWSRPGWPYANCWDRSGWNRARMGVCGRLMKCIRPCWCGMP